MFKFIRKINLEALAWITGLLYLAFINPASTHHFSFCFFKFLGFDYCPGCGLGLSISYLLHGDFASSFQAHPLGSVALVILTYRIFSLFRRAFLRSITIENTKTYRRKHGKYSTGFA